MDPEVGGPFYVVATHAPFAALLHVHDHVWKDREFSSDERDYTCGILAGFAFRVNERFRRVAKG